MHFLNSRFGLCLSMSNRLITSSVVYASAARNLLNTLTLSRATSCQLFKLATSPRNFKLPSRTMASNAPVKFGTIERDQGPSNHFFRQLFDRDSCTYTYLLADTKTKEAVLIDPVIEHAQRDVEQLNDLGLKLIYCINTHMHADHITGTGLLKKLVPDCKSIISQRSGAKADIYVKDGDCIKYGDQKLEVRETPGHTNGCITYVNHSLSCAFTGDAVLIRGCGRTDFQEGNPETLYDSVWKKVFSLPDSFKIYPAHDYKGRTETSVAEEKALNPRLTKTKAEFVNIMDNLGLSYPKKIDVSLPANKVCGMYELPDEIKKMYDEA